MKIAFVGMGSIGKRHLRNVRRYLTEKEIPCTIDLYRSGDSALESDIQALADRELLLGVGCKIAETYDVVFITNPTALHEETVRRFAPFTGSMFIEKPVFARTNVDLKQMALHSKGIYYVACPLRYHPVIQYVMKHIPLETVYAARAISSSYLPDWRPNVDYRTCYSAHREMGGGVDIDLIHEWDYLCRMFGPVRQGFSIRNHISGLEIDSVDIAVYIAQAEHTVLELHLDYFGRYPIRTLQLFLPEETISCDLLNAIVKYEREGKEISFSADRNAYQADEIRHFFEILDGTRENDSTIEDALRALRYAQGDFSR